MPSLMLHGHPHLNEYAIKNAIDYVQTRKSVFCATASYGKLHIDELHGLFAIAQTLDKEGKPKTGNNVFSAFDLSEVGIFCTSPRTDHNIVVVDVEFRCFIEELRLLISVIIKKNVHCKTKRIDAEHVGWDEPGDLDMFRTLFNQMLSGIFEKTQHMLCGEYIHKFKIEKAQSLFMLPDNYTLSDLKKARRLMMKVYHPDVADEDVSREAQLINDAYELLKNELKGDIDENA